MDRSMTLDRTVAERDQAAPRNRLSYLPGSDSCWSDLTHGCWRVRHQGRRPKRGLDLGSRRRVGGSGNRHRRNGRRRWRLARDVHRDGGRHRRGGRGAGDRDDRREPLCPARGGGPRDPFLPECDTRVPLAGRVCAAPTADRADPPPRPEGHPAHPSAAEGATSPKGSGRGRAQSGAEPRRGKWLGLGTELHLNDRSPLCGDDSVRDKHSRPLVGLDGKGDPNCDALVTHLSQLQRFNGNFADARPHPLASTKASRDSWKQVATPSPVRAVMRAWVSDTVGFTCTSDRTVAFPSGGSNAESAVASPSLSSLSISEISTPRHSAKASSYATSASSWASPASSSVSTHSAGMSLSTKMASSAAC